jgi:hypothetical protein
LGHNSKINKFIEFHMTSAFNRCKDFREFTENYANQYSY